jgi:hypothetical protein
MSDVTHVDMLVQFRDLKSACGGISSYAVISAAEAGSHGQDCVDMIGFASDDCLLTSRGFGLRETGPEPGHQIGAGIYQALRKRRTCRGLHTSALHPIDKPSIIPSIAMLSLLHI